MAPNTRLRDTPSRRVMYSDAAQERAAALRNRAEVENTRNTPPRRRRSHAPEPAEVERRVLTNDNASDPIQAPAAPQIRHRSTGIKQNPRGRTATSDLPLRPVVGGHRITKVAPAKKEKKKKHQTKDCVLCAETKRVDTSFPCLEKEPCAHLRDICNRCVRKMVKTQTADQLLNEATMPCPFPECTSSGLDHAALKTILPVAEFEVWDKALTTHLLRSDEDYIACLSTKCGRYFSRESCQAKRNKREIECPYCDYAMCLTCGRPWHPKTSCNAEKNAENAKSEVAIRKMGAKACPKCGVNIEKNGGCDHMTCMRCRHHFCFDCLVMYAPDMVHREGCKNVAQNIANDPRNWVQDNDVDVRRELARMDGMIAQILETRPRNAAEQATLEEAHARIQVDRQRLRAIMANNAAPQPRPQFPRIGIMFEGGAGRLNDLIEGVGDFFAVLERAIGQRLAPPPPLPNANPQEGAQNGNGA